jgi:hypothetical protein
MKWLRRIDAPDDSEYLEQERDKVVSQRREAEDRQARTSSVAESLSAHLYVNHLTQRIRRTY